MTPVKKERRDQREVRQKQSTSFWDIIETEAPYFLYARHETYTLWDNRCIQTVCWVVLLDEESSSSW
jgi:hypothetical protein